MRVYNHPTNDIRIEFINSIFYGIDVPYIRYPYITLIRGFKIIDYIIKNKEPKYTLTCDVSERSFRIFINKYSNITTTNNNNNNMEMEAEIKIYPNNHNIIKLINFKYTTPISRIFITIQECNKYISGCLL